MFMVSGVFEILWFRCVTRVQLIDVAKLQLGSVCVLVNLGEHWMTFDLV